MKNKIIPLGSLDKVLAFTDDQILISRNEHESIESLQADAKRKIVPMSSVKELFYINPKWTPKSEQQSFILGTWAMNRISNE